MGGYGDISARRLDVGFHSAGGLVDPAFGVGVGQHAVDLGLPFGVGGVAGQLSHESDVGPEVVVPL